MTCPDTVRLATESDAEQLAALYVGTLRDAYGGEMPADLVDPETAHERAAKFRNAILSGSRTWIVSACDHRIIGFCGLCPARDDDLSHDVGEIPAFVIDRAHRRHGHGLRLLGAARAEAGRLGWHSIVLWVVDANASARAFYTAAGFAPDGGFRSDNRLGFQARVLRYRRRVDAD